MVIQAFESSLQVLPRFLKHRSTFHLFEEESFRVHSLKLAQMSGERLVTLALNAHTFVTQVHVQILHECMGLTSALLLRSCLISSINAASFFTSSDPTGA